MAKLKFILVACLFFCVLGCDKFIWLDLLPDEASKAQLEAFSPVKISCSASILNKVNLSISIRSSESFSPDFLFLSESAAIMDEEGSTIFQFNNDESIKSEVEQLSENEYKLSIRNGSVFLIVKI